MNQKRLPVLLPSLFAAALALSGCQSETAPEPSEEPPLAGAAIGGSFTLTGETGEEVSSDDFAGQYRIVYFGYTFCPDVCPVDAQVIGRAMQLLEERDPGKAGAIVPLFVSVDPGRDTPEALAEFTDNFHPRMIGLTGTREQIDRVTQDYGVYYALGEDDGSGNYLVDHSNNAILFGPTGDPIAILSVDRGAETVADELDRWVE